MNKKKSLFKGSTLPKTNLLRNYGSLSKWNGFEPLFALLASLVSFRGSERRGPYMMQGLRVDASPPSDGMGSQG